MYLLAVLLIGYLLSFLQQLPSDWGNLEEVLLFLAAGGGAVVTAFFFSWLAENFEFWHKFDSKLKLVLSLVLSVGIGVGAYYLLSLPELISLVQPYYALIVTIILAWLGSQVAYMKSKANAYGANYCCGKKK
jgi:hypothetical protein